MGRVTNVTPTKVTKGIKVITEATKTKVTKITGNQSAGGGYQGKNPRGGKYNPPQGGPNSSSDSAGQNQVINDYDVDSPDILNLPDVVSFISHVDTLPTLIQLNICMTRLSSLLIT